MHVVLTNDDENKPSRNSDIARKEQRKNNHQQQHYKLLFDSIFGVNLIQQQRQINSPTTQHQPKR